MTTQQIETRANIVKPRIRKLLRAYAESKSELYRTRVDRLLQRLDKEYASLESKYRKAKHLEFKEKQWLKDLAKTELVRLN